MCVKRGYNEDFWLCRERFSQLQSNQPFSRASRTRVPTATESILAVKYLQVTLLIPTICVWKPSLLYKTSTIRCAWWHALERKPLLPRRYWRLETDIGVEIGNQQTFIFLARGLISIYERAQGNSRPLGRSLLQQVRELCVQVDASCRQRVPNLKEGWRSFMECEESGMCYFAIEGKGSQIHTT